MPEELCIRFTINPELMKTALAAGLLVALSLPLMPETLTMTSYYPAPLGVYNKLTSTGKTVLARDGGSVGIGTGTEDPSPTAALEIKSTTKGFLPPRMTTAQRDAIANPVAGLTIFNVTTRKIEVYNGTTWSGTTAPSSGVQVAIYRNDDPRRNLSTTYINDSGKTRLFMVTTATGVDLVLGVYGPGVSPTFEEQCAGYSPYYGFQRGCMLMAVVPPGGLYGAFNYSFACNPYYSPANCYKYWAEYDF